MKVADVAALDQCFDFCSSTIQADHCLIPLLMPLFIPLTLLPKLRHLAPTNILADILILAGGTACNRVWWSL